MKKKFFPLVIMSLFTTGSAYAQTGTVNLLDEVVLSDLRLYQNSKGQQVSILNDSTLTENEPLLSSLLKFNTPIFFKENGYGMVSSASFRGTTASQTAVIWNGININSQFLGQTDFNTIPTGNFDNVAVRAGGGSVLYGSGAIGGSVHLNNKFQFNRGFQNRLRLEYGSFNTFSGQIKTDYSSESTNLQASVTRHSSDNDYPYLGTDKFNANGDFFNTGFSIGVAHLLNKNNTLKFHSNYFDGEKALSGTLYAPSRSKYTNEDSRNLLEWKRFFTQFTSSLKLAYLHENYRYYSNRERENYDYGRAKTGIAKYDLRYEIQEGININGIIDLQYTKGEGSNVGINERAIGALALLLSHDLGRFSYELSGRKEISDRYVSPVLFSLGANYVVTPFYGLNLNLSKNFRIPTYNDLFWRGGGDLELSPEESHQAEFGQNVVFRDFEFSLTAYIIRISNLLRWVPDSSGMWRSGNAEKVENHGVETRLGWHKVFGDHQINLNATYAYTRTNDEKLDKELIYTPTHKTTASVGYGIKPFSAYFQFLQNGSIFTSADNKYELEGYTVSNAGLNYNIGKKEDFRLGMKVLNLWNTSYQSLPSRPMPGRSINGSLTFKF